MRLVSLFSFGLIVMVGAGCKPVVSIDNCAPDDDSCNGGGGSGGGGPSGAAQTLVDGSALLQSVSSDQSWMAYLQHTNDGAVTSGDLLVAPLSSPAQARVLAQNAYSASLSTDSRLFFLVDPQPSIDANSTATYGRLQLWSPAMTDAAQLSSGFAAIRVIGPGNGYALFWDEAMPTTAAPADVKLARAGDCNAVGCTVTTLLPGVGGVATTATSSDGRFAAFAVRDAGHGYDVYLVDVLAATVAKVISGGSGDSISFSSDGALFAAVGPAGALRVFDSASRAPVAWSAVPAEATVVQVAFSDPATLVLRATAAGGKQADAYVTTAAASTVLATAVNGLGVYRSAASGGRWAVVSHDYASGLGGLEAYDLTGASPAPITVASSSTFSSLGLSPDGRYLRVLESYDTSAASGDLVVVSLSDGQRQTIASDIGLAAPSFFGDLHELAYLDGNGKLTVWNDASSTDLADGVVNWRARGGDATLYFTVGDAGDSIFGYTPGIYTQPAP